MRKVIIILSALLLSVGTCFAQLVTGVVRGADKTLSGVVVTDGVNFTVTDAAGAFKMKADSKADFIYIVTPAGYTAPIGSGTPQFYLPVESSRKSYDFDLQPLKGASDDYVMIAIADPQTQNQRHFDRFVKESIPDLKGVVADYTAKGKAVAGISLGDICWDNDSFWLYDSYKAQIATLGIPFYPVIGNHDHNRLATSDYDAEADYRKTFGPNYYAFQMGKTHYIVLDNIIYYGDKKFDEEISDKQIEWVKRYVKYVPKGAELFIAMHAPAQKAFKGESPKKSVSKLLTNLSQYKVSFMSGHTHINFRKEVVPGVLEHNVASIGGTWWTADYCKDGSPCGYEVFEVNGDKMTWYYKSTGYDRSYQLKLFPRGTVKGLANSIVAKVWDWEEKWSVKWFEDGVDMGEMVRFTTHDPDYLAYVYRKYTKPNKVLPGYKSPTNSMFFFQATPSANAKEVTVVATDRFGNSYKESIKLDDIQTEGHRGGRGLMPENSVAAMINAINLGVNTLEMDMSVSKDKKVLISHDPYMNYKFVTKPDGGAIAKADTKKYKLYAMTYDSIRTYEIGLAPYADFPEQKRVRTYKPLLSEMIDSVENYVAKNKLGEMFYNIEIKSSASKDDVYTPNYKEFADLAMAVFNTKNLGKRLLIQSFDVRALKYMHEQYPQVRLSYLVDNKSPYFEANIKELGFVPEVYSPQFEMVTPQMMEIAHQLGMRVVPWTVNESADIQKMLDLKVNSIISDYPDRVLKLTRKQY